MGEVTAILDIVDRLDVPSLALLTLYGFWRLHRTVSSSMTLHQQAFVGALSAIEKRMAAETTEMRNVTDTLKEHVRADREDFQRVFDKVEDTRKEMATAMHRVNGR